MYIARGRWAVGHSRSYMHPRRASRPSMVKYLHDLIQGSSRNGHWAPRTNHLAWVLNAPSSNGRYGIATPPPTFIHSTGPPENQRRGKMGVDGTVTHRAFSPACCSLFRSFLGRIPAKTPWDSREKKIANGPPSRRRPRGPAIAASFPVESQGLALTYTHTAIRTPRGGGNQIRLPTWASPHVVLGPLDRKSVV